MYIVCLYQQIECLRAHDYIIGEFDRHNAHNSNFAARLLPGCHSAYQLFASCRADCLEMEPRLGVPNPFPPPPIQQPPPSTNPNVVTITCADLDHNSPATQVLRELRRLASCGTRTCLRREGGTEIVLNRWLWMPQGTLASCTCVLVENIKGQGDIIFGPLGT